MALIDISYFVGNLNIPNSGDSAIAETINWFINKHEPYFLQKLFGQKLYASYLQDNTTNRFKDIIDGKDYTDLNGYAKHWKGLIEVLVPNTIPQTKQSIIANYVYYWYQRTYSTQTFGVNEARPNAENATKANARQKVLTAWNEMIEPIHSLMEFLLVNGSIYPEWTLIDRNRTLREFAFINPLF
jgi:hypothetical protein